MGDGACSFIHLGPAFTHPTVPHSAHYIGATSPRDAPAHYIAAVEACMNVYRLDIARAVDLPEQASMDIHDDRTADLIPLVVNTMGWTKGLGADLNAQIASLVAPTHVFEFAPHTFSDRGGIMDYSLPKTDITGYESTYHLDPVESPLSTYFTPADHRALNVLSYFHAIFPAATDFRSVTAKGWTPASLVTRPPYEVQWHTALPGGLVLSASGAEDVVPEEVALALPGAIIALVALEPGADLDITGHTSSPSNPELNYTQGRPAPSPQTSYCLGLAVLRGLSIPSPDEIAHSRSPSAVAQILTPIPPALFGRVHTAVKGALELPTWGMLDGSIREDGVAGWPRDRVPYLRWVNVQEDAQAHGTDRRRVRRNLMRKGQM
jgi:polynucleotide 5'-hydroxyl-kinase GRC3/NOL9